MERRWSRTFALVLAFAACSPRAPRASRVEPVDAAAPRASEPIEAAAPRALPLVPAPRAVAPLAGELVLRATDRIAIDRPELEEVGRWLADTLGLAGVDLTDAPRAIALTLGPGPDDRDARVALPRGPADEAYALVVSPERAAIRATTRIGLFYGAQTLAQLAGARRPGAPPAAGPWHVPALRIEDAPRLRYRAMHLDVARHFFGREDVLRYVDLLAFYRFNVFHWHLTDDQGFRFPSRSHPELARVAGNGAAYSEEDVRTVVREAGLRGITVIPEIEMPGHARAILAAHPELSCTGRPGPLPRAGGIFEDVLCAGNPGSLALVDDLLNDVAVLFPGELVHIGGDEVPPARWRACPKCRAAAARAGVPVPALEGRFLQHAAATLQRLGRRPMVWDEGLGATPADAPSPDTVVVAWQSRARGLEAARRGHDVVMAPHDEVYFNTRQSRTGAEPGQEGYLPWTTVARFDPVPTEPALAARVLGGEGALWTEHVERRAELETLAMPRLAVLAEALWSPRVGADLPARLQRQRAALAGLAYFVDAPEGLPPRRVFLAGDTARVALAPPALFPDGVVRFTRDGSAPTAASPAFIEPLALTTTTTLAAATFLPDGRRSPALRGVFVAETPRPALPAPGERRRPGARFRYVEGHFDRLPDLERARPTATGVAAAIDLASVGAVLGPRLRAEDFALRFDAVFEVPTTGIHRLVATADDGVRVRVDGDVVVEDDGNHAPRAARGEIALAAGAHRLQVAYFQGAEGKELTLELEDEHGARKPVAVWLDAP